MLRETLVLPLSAGFACKARHAINQRVYIAGSVEVSSEMSSAHMTNGDVGVPKSNNAEDKRV
jgi:hypothetical protein